MNTKFLYIILFLQSPLWAINTSHERPADDEQEEPQAKKSKKFVSALHQLCHEGSIEDIISYLENDNAHDEINQFEQNSDDDFPKTPFIRFMDYYELNEDKINKLDLIKIISLFFARDAKINYHSIEFLDGDIVKHILIDNMKLPEFNSQKINNIALFYDIYINKSIKECTELELNFLHQQLRNFNGFIDKLNIHLTTVAKHYEEMLTYTTATTAFLRTFNSLQDLFASKLINNIDNKEKYMTIISSVLTGNTENRLTDFSNKYKLKNKIDAIDNIENLINVIDNIEQIVFDVKFIEIFNKINTLYNSQFAAKLSDKAQLFKNNFDIFKTHINHINDQEIKNNIVSSLIINLFTIEDYKLFIEWHDFIENNKNNVSSSVKFILKNKISSIENIFEDWNYSNKEQHSKGLIIYFYYLNILNLDKNKIILILLSKKINIYDKNYNFDGTILSILKPLNENSMNNFVNLIKEAISKHRNINNKNFKFIYNLFLTKNLNIITLIKEDFLKYFCFSSNYKFMIFLLENNFTASDSFLKKALIWLLSCQNGDVNYDKGKFLDLFLEKISNKNHAGLHKGIAQTSKFPEDEELQKLLPVLIRHNVDVNRKEYHNWIAYFAQNTGNLEFFKEHNIKYTLYCLLRCLTSNKTSVEDKLNMIDFFMQQNININEEFNYKSKKTNILIAYCDSLEAFSKKHQEKYLYTDMRIIEKLITYEIDINAVFNNNTAFNNTALSTAIYKRQTEVIKFLLLHNADIKNSDLKIALQPFNQNPPNILIVLMLLAKNVALDESDNNNPSLIYASAIKNKFFKAIGDNDLSKMQEFINEGYGFLVNAIDNDGPIISKYEEILSSEMLDLLAEYMTKRGTNTKSARKG